jgi:hypothetical protein
MNRSTADLFLPPKAGVPRRVASHEARMTRAVFAAGFPAPEVLDEVTLEGRFGIVLPRLVVHGSFTTSTRARIAA